MLKKCEQCTKTVYPTEKLTCLDKTWHKACFTCTECNLRLSKKTYKAYNNLPYCNAHYPQTDTQEGEDAPENEDLAENAETQSENMYRAMFDYDAADDEEVTFIEGDLIVNCHPKEEGWMTGEVQRTGLVGILPANYVERVQE